MNANAAVILSVRADKAGIAVFCLGQANKLPGDVCNLVTIFFQISFCKHVSSARSLTA
jgi:hypothetical protein